MRVLIVGGATWDYFVPFKKVQREVKSLLSEIMKKRNGLQKGVELKKFDEYVNSKEDVEIYFNKLPEKIRALKKKATEKRIGGCGAIKALVFAKKYKTTLLSWRGRDAEGKELEKELREKGVETEFTISGKTPLTINITGLKHRFSISEWKNKLDLKKIDKIGFDLLLLTSAHNSEKPIGYTKIAKKIKNSYIFTGSFYGRSEKWLREKYEKDYSRGTLIMNSEEALRIAGMFGKVKNIKEAAETIPDKNLVIHGKNKIIVKKNEVREYNTLRAKNVKRLTGAGDIWEACYLIGGVSYANRMAKKYIEGEKL